MMILFVKLTKGIGHKFCQLMKSSPINTINSHNDHSEHAYNTYRKYIVNNVINELITKNKSCVGWMQGWRVDNYRIIILQGIFLKI